MTSAAFSAQTMAATCTHQKYMCGNAHPYTTATVFQSNYTGSKYACHEYCLDGCCYLFDPTYRVDLKSSVAIVAWVISLLYLLVGLAMSYAVSTSVDSYTVSLSVNGQPKNITKTKKYSLIGCILSTHVAISVSLVVSVLLFQLTNQQQVEERISWTFAPRAAKLTAISITSFLALATFVFLLFVCCSRGNEELVQRATKKLDNSTNAASALVALIAICLLPLVGGWDGISGIAFSDKDPDDQSYAQNRVRYASFVSQQNSMLGIVISFITKTLFGMLFQMLFRW